MGDEGSSSKLDNLSKEDLVKLVKKYIIIHKQLRTKNEDLSKQLESSKCSSNNDQNNSDTAKDLNDKLEQLTKSNHELNNENTILKDKIQSLNEEIKSLNSSLEEFKTFKLELEPQLENAKREINLNKSMLEMLNNEIKLLNSEKLQLEKRLINTRRIGTPSIIVEEDEEDLEEEKRNESYSPNNLQPIAEEETDLNEGETIENYKKDEFDRDIEFLRQNRDENNKISSLNKQLEDMTFYIDELKSELEAEREKNAEFVNEIDALRLKLESKQSEQCTEPGDLKLKFDKFLHFLKDDLVLSEGDNKSFSEELTDLQKELIEKLREKIVNKNVLLNKESESRKYLESQLEKVIQNFKQEITDLEVKLESASKAKLEVETKLRQVESELESTQEKFKKKEASKSKVLDLEIADYERSIKTLNVQLIAKDKEINDLKQELSSVKENQTKLNQQIETLERERDDEKEKSTKLKQLLVKAKKDVADAKTHETEHLTTEAQLKAQLESLNQDVESYKIQNAELTAERQRLQEKLHSISDTYNRSNQLIETKSQSYLNEIDDLKQKLSSLQLDYDNYKLKVQHAFKKQKEQSESNNSTLNNIEVQKYCQEIDQLKLVVVKLNEKLDERQEKIKLLERENEITQEEYSRVLDRNTKLINELKDKENEWKSKANELSRTSSLRTDEVNETIRNLKLENEALVTQQREKIKSLNSQHLHTIDSLQIQLDESRREIERLNKSLNDLRNRSPSPGDLTPNNSLVQIQTKLESVQVNSLSPGVRNNFILGINGSQLSERSDNEDRNSIKTLEQLLNEPAPSSSGLVTTDSQQLLNQMTQLKTDLAKSKMQLDHLNELLNESELNNARLSEQITLLKDEIRRLERNQERESSISNMEYLKNVVCKFLTLSTPQEKSQLLPVLTTMLKLSQEEQNAIMSFAKNNHNGQDSQSAGWTTFLPKWSS